MHSLIAGIANSFTDNLLAFADDAAAAKWWPLNALPKLAFDHNKILADAVQALKING